MSSLSSSEPRKDASGNGSIDINAEKVLNNGNVCEKFPRIKPEGKVLVLYTGGTIGMLRNEEGGRHFC